VEPDHPSAEDETVAAEPRPVALPPQAARLEDVLTPTNGVRDASAEGTSRASVPPPEIHVEVRLSPQARRDVARLEDVLTVLPDGDSDTSPSASVPPPEVTDPPASTSEGSEHRIAPRTAAAALPEAEVPALAPMYVAAHRLRSAFLFEQTAAFESRGDEEEIIEADDVVEETPVASIAELGPDVDLEPADASDQPASQSHWMAALCLLALLALVVALTGRKPCRCAHQR
jgi:hypothetical protein